jgi:hypothetical protein
LTVTKINYLYVNSGDFIFIKVDKALNKWRFGEKAIGLSKILFNLALKIYIKISSMPFSSRHKGNILHKFGKGLYECWMN